MNNGKEIQVNSIQNLRHKIQNIKKPQTLEEYFILIGVDPQISINEELYKAPIIQLNEKYSKSDFKPKILSKFPPINKAYINIDDDIIIDLCFPTGFNLLQFDKKPKSIFQHFILDNSFYSIDYPLKYISCLKIYESLYHYYLLNNEIKKKCGNARKKENCEKAINENNDLNNEFKNYYFPKVLCMISTENFFQAQEQILKQIYIYYKNKKITRNIPIEKIILSILFNFPLPPKGTLSLEYNLMENQKKIEIKREPMNRLPEIKEEINLIFNKFDETTFLEIFKYIVFEIKILIFGSNVNELSYFIYGLISLLFPFKYSFQISSSIPNNSYHVLESVFPYILGINKIFKKNFFKENRIDMRDLDLLIIDLDKGSIKFLGKKVLPEFPRNLFKPLYEGLYNAYKLKTNLCSENEAENNYKDIRRLFFNFFVNLMENYELYIKNDYFKNKLTNTGIYHLFKIDEFINSHSSNEIYFYQKITQTQMFCDFIYRKMLPKDTDEKLEILFFDESLMKKMNKKFFSKKKTCVFLDSKDYEYNKIYEVPQSKMLSKEEQLYFNNVKNNNILLNYGQKINRQLNKITNEYDYIFEYFLFPVLNESFFNFSSNEYFAHSDSSIFSEIDRINTDILSEALKNSSNNINNKCEEEMKNYIYLSYLELWAYNYWYLDSFEKEQKFNELMDILSKISFHETEIFDNIFESLHKFKERNKILKLYDFLLNAQIPLSSYIYNTVNTYIFRRFNKSASTRNLKNVCDFFKNKKFQKKTFHSIKDGRCLGDTIKFYNKQKCPECGQEINITEMCFNFKNMIKDFFWAKCPKCEKYIIPKLGVILGTEIINKEENQDLYCDYYSSNYNRFILHSPYELKTHLKIIKKKDEFKMFHVERFKQDYPSLFWSCIWYFKLYKINIDIILPYESTISRELFNHEDYNIKNIVSMVYINKSNNNLNINNSNKKIKKIKKFKKMNKYLNNNLIIHNVISTSILPIQEKDKRSSTSSYNKNNSDTYCRQSTKESSKSLNSCELLFGANKELNLQSDKDKNNKFKSCANFSSRVRLYTLTSNYLLSPTLKSRKLFDERSSTKLISIKEKEDNNIIFPFTPSQDEEDEEQESTEYDGFIKLYSTKTNEISDFNFKSNKKLKKEIMVKRKQTFENVGCFKLFDYKKKNSRNKSVKNINKSLLLF